VPAQAVTHYRILQARDKGVGAAGMRPVWDDGVESGTRCSVWILISSNVDASRSCFLDSRDRVLHLAPIRFARRLQMVDLHPRVRALTDRDRFFDCLYEARTF